MINILEDLNKASVHSFQFHEDLPEIVDNILSTYDLHTFWKRYLSPSAHIEFFNTVSIRTMDACRQGQYTDFDGHTTSNCCHGIAILAHHLIKVIFAYDCNFIKDKILQIELEIRREITYSNFSIDAFPKEFFYLMGLYVLNFIGEIEPLKGR